VAALYLDENIEPPIGRLLARRGHDVLTTQDAGQKGATDPQQLLTATEAGRIVVTHDDDFLFIHRWWNDFSGLCEGTLPREHAAVLLVPGAPILAFGEVARLVDDFVRANPNLWNAHFRLNRSGVWSS
jgi:hypothetical protein